MPIVRNQLYIAMSLVISAQTAVCSQRETPGRAEVEVHIPAVAGHVDVVAMMRAWTVASRIYERVGITLRWKQSGKQGADCSRPDKRVVLRFSTKTPRGFRAGAFGQAFPYADRGACVIVFLDRIAEMARRNPTNTAHLLGHILAHEIGHYLQGIDRHSDGGVMKGYWTLREIRSMSSEPMRFTEYDRSLLEMVLGPLKGNQDRAFATRPAPGVQSSGRDSHGNP